jgi:protein-tyrosine phosphatase
MIKLADNLYVGGYYDARDERELRAQGISAVLNVGFELNDPIFDQKIIRQAKVGLMDGAENTPFMKDLAVNVAFSLMKAGEILLVHCNAGWSRSVFVCTMVLAEQTGKDYHDVYAEIQKKHPFALYGPLFHGQNKYYRALEEESNKKYDEVAESEVSEMQKTNESTART